MSPAGTKDDPWQLTTAPGSSTYTMYADPESDPPLLVCQVGSTRLTYLLAAIEDLSSMLRAHGDWMPLGAADADFCNDGQNHVLGRDARRQRTVDVHEHAARLLLPDALRGEHLVDLRCADAEGESPERTMGRGMRVAAV